MKFYFHKSGFLEITPNSKNDAGKNKDEQKEIKTNGHQTKKLNAIYSRLRNNRSFQVEFVEQVGNIQQQTLASTWHTTQHTRRRRRRKENHAEMKDQRTHNDRKKIKMKENDKK